MGQWWHWSVHSPAANLSPTLKCAHQAGFYPLGGGGGAGGKLLPQTPKLPPQNLVTDHGSQENFGLNHIKSDLKTPQYQKISWGILPQTPYNVYFCSKLLYSLHCNTCFPPKSTFLDRTLPGTVIYERDLHEFLVASFPGSFRGRGKEPGTHCLRMRLIKI